MPGDRYLDLDCKDGLFDHRAISKTSIVEDFAISLLAFANNFVDNLANFATPVANFAAKNGEYLKQPVAASNKKGLRDSN